MFLSKNEAAQASAASFVLIKRAKSLLRFALLSPCSNFLSQVTLRFGSENESFFDFHFALLSPCSNFAPKYIGISK